MADTTTKEALMRTLQAQDFVLDDITLFLQSHPDDQTALSYYQKFRKLKQETENEYTEKFGPLTADNVEATDRFVWVDTPWPWERQV